MLSGGNTGLVASFSTRSKHLLDHCAMPIWPTVKFYNVKSKIFTKKAAKESDLLNDNKDATWLDEPADMYPSEMFLKAVASSPIDLAASVHLRTFLADDKLAIASEHVMKAAQISQPSAALNNNNFSMDLD